MLWSGRGSRDEPVVGHGQGQGPVADQASVSSFVRALTRAFYREGRRDEKRQARELLRCQATSYLYRWPRLGLRSRWGAQGQASGLYTGGKAGPRDAGPGRRTANPRRARECVRHGPAVWAMPLPWTARWRARGHAVRGTGRRRLGAFAGVCWLADERMAATPPKPGPWLRCHCRPALSPHANNSLGTVGRFFKQPNTTMQQRDGAMKGAVCAATGTSSFPRSPTSIYHRRYLSRYFIPTPKWRGWFPPTNGPRQTKPVFSTLVIQRCGMTHSRGLVRRHLASMFAPKGSHQASDKHAASTQHPLLAMLPRQANLGLRCASTCAARPRGARPRWRQGEQTAGGPPAPGSWAPRHPRAGWPGGYLASDQHYCQRACSHPFIEQYLYTPVRGAPNLNQATEAKKPPLDCLVETEQRPRSSPSLHQHLCRSPW